MSPVCCSLKTIRLCVGGLLSSDPPPTPEVKVRLSPVDSKARVSDVGMELCVAGP